RQSAFRVADSNRNRGGHLPFLEIDARKCLITAKWNPQAAEAGCESRTRLLAHRYYRNHLVGLSVEPRDGVLWLVRDPDRFIDRQPVGSTWYVEHGVRLQQGHRDSHSRSFHSGPRLLWRLRRLRRCRPNQKNKDLSDTKHP